MKPKPFCTSNHLHVPVTRSLAPVQKQRRGANMADLPDHIVSAFIIDVDFAAAKAMSLRPTSRTASPVRETPVLPRRL